MNSAQVSMSAALNTAEPASVNVPENVIFPVLRAIEIASIITLLFTVPILNASLAPS